MNMQQDISKRKELQEEAIEKLRTERRLILNWGTRVAKSRVAVMSMKFILEAIPDARFLLMVQENNHKKNWAQEFEDALGKAESERILNHTTIDCYASLKKHESSEWDLIVFDEGHHLRSPLRLKSLKTMNAARVLVLTATASDKNDGDELLITLDYTFGPFVSMTFGLQDAIDSKANVSAINPVHKANIASEDTKKVIWMVNQDSGEFVNTDGVQAASIKGVLIGIDQTNSPRPYYIIKLQDEFNGTVNLIYNPKKLSISILALLSKLRKPDEQPLLINVYKYGAWPNYTIFKGRNKIVGGNEVFKNYPKDNEAKIQYLDYIAKLINEKIDKKYEKN